MTDPLEFYPSKNIGDLVFAWIPTTVGYGKNLMFSGKYGYGMIAGSVVRTYSWTLEGVKYICTQKNKKSMH